jgi:molybdopterin molybdotransferase
MPAPLPYRDARARVIERVRPLARPRPEEVELAAAEGRFLAEDVPADRDQPPFHRATRDGYAVRAADARPGATLRVVGEIAAGGGLAREIGAGEAAEIMTGAPLPDGADAVVMVEHTTREDDVVTLPRGIAAGENFVPAGSELAAGAAAVLRGARIGPGEVALLAAVGKVRVAVGARPRVAILPTGDELVDAAETPGPYQIRNSNGPMLAAQVRRAGGEPRVFPRAPDDEPTLRALVERALAGADLAVFSGGVSMGKYDLLEGVLASLGARIDFDGVAVRPGKPVVFGLAGETPFFGLPGNPLSSLVTFELLARPAIELLAGAVATPLPLLLARLAVEHRQPELPLTVFTPARLDGDLAEPLPSQGSGDLTALARASGFIVTEPGVRSLPAGTLVPFLPR